VYGFLGMRAVENRLILRSFGRGIHKDLKQFMANTESRFQPGTPTRLFGAANPKINPF
jgi:hypothetical protein